MVTRRYYHEKTNQKHLTLEDRNYFEQAPNLGMNFKEIAKFLSKDSTTISKEIKKHRIRKEPNTFNGCSNICKNRFVCNSCSSKGACRLVKYYYRALPSYHQYKHTLSTSRQGINLSNEVLCELDNIVSLLIKQGQTISHIYQTQNLKCSKSLLYNYIGQNQLSARNIYLPRRVRFSKRKSKKIPPKDNTIRKGRTYENFEKYLLDNPDASIVEMDTVEGKKCGKVLLTMLFRNSKLMIAFLLQDKTRNSVLKVFNWLESILGNELFTKTFPVILTDNGIEFSNLLSLEFNHDGTGKTKIFFCNPGASYQKGAIEKIMSLFAM